MIFDESNPRHIEILREELKRAKRILTEAYSADRLWGNMTPDERKSALYVAKAPNPEEYLDKRWDDIPADMQDLIDLSDYERATENNIGRSLYRGALDIMKRDEKNRQRYDRLLSQYLRNVNKATIEELTVREMENFHDLLIKFKNKITTPTMWTTDKPSALTPDAYKDGQGRGNWQGD